MHIHWNMTSDDNARVAHNVEFDGFDDDDGAHHHGVRAGYRSIDADGHGLPDTVYGADDIDHVWDGPAVLAFIAFALAVLLAGRWGDLQRTTICLQRALHPPKSA